MINYNKLHKIYDNEIKDPTINKRFFKGSLQPFSMIAHVNNEDEALEVKTIMNARKYRYIKADGGIDVYIQR